MSVDERQSAESYDDLRDVVATSLPELATLEPQTEDQRQSLLVARGREEALQLLNGPIANPSQLGNPPQNE